jgi:hypothetical protein
MDTPRPHPVDTETNIREAAKAIAEPPRMNKDMCRTTL